jgi:hypothetical protein
MLPWDQSNGIWFFLWNYVPEERTQSWFWGLNIPFSKSMLEVEGLEGSFGMVLRHQ